MIRAIPHLLDPGIELKLGTPELETTWCPEATGVRPGRGGERRLHAVLPAKHALAATADDSCQLTDRRGQDMHLAAVLGHGPAGDANPVIEEPIAYLRIAQCVAGGALIADDLLNDVFDAE